MRLHRLEVWNWRGLEHEVLRELAPDLNLIVGPNESGKSRLFEALRYALFERYKGDSEEKRRLRSWGGSESPTVEVEFETAGSTFCVRKRLLKGAAARLEGGGATWVDEDAEDQLRRLWGTREIKGRRDVEQFLGLWPLLWVQQGKAGQPPHIDLNDDARARLSDALAAQVHEVVAGRKGQRVLERAEAERAMYWTAGSRERGELLAARERKTKATRALEEALALREQGRGAAAELSSLEAAVSDGAARIRAQLAEVEAARSRAVAARERSAALRGLEAELASLVSQRELCRRRLEERVGLASEHEALAAEVGAQGRALADLAALRGSLEHRRSAAQSAVERAEADEEKARAARFQATRGARRIELQRRVEELREMAQKASELAEARGKLDHEIASLRVDATEMRALRKARETFARANAALAAASARVQVRAMRDLLVDGEVLAAGHDRSFRLDEPTSIQLDGIAEIHVSPAGAELHRLRDEERDARQVLEAKLSALGVGSLAEAEERLHRRIECEAERKHLDSLSELTAPSGTKVIGEALRMAEAELDGLSLAADGPITTLESAEAELARAGAALRDARAARDLVEGGVARAKQEEAAIGGRREDARARLETLAKRLREMPPHEQLADGVLRADEAWARAVTAKEAFERELQRQGDRDAETDLEREERALAQLERTHREQRDRCIDLQATVRHLGVEGVHERVLSAETELTEATSELTRVERRAAAARALVEALTRARHEVQERFVAPVREKVEPYLHGLLPEVTLDIDESWNVRGLRSGNRIEDFEALSWGAREQVGLLVRLGLAEVLGQDEPLPIVLDDCLVNTDPGRHRDMLRILYQAAKKQQIVLFSCHDVAFERLGATRRYELASRRLR